MANLNMGMYRNLSGRVGRVTPASHRTVREPLDSHGSYCSVCPTLQAQCAKSFGSLLFSLLNHRVLATTLLCSFLYLRIAHLASTNSIIRNVGPSSDRQ
jgi:hypothetical protein